MKTESPPILSALEDDAIQEILQTNFVGTLGFIAHSDPHVLPVTYYYDSQTHSLICYSHEGHKVQAMRENPSISLNVFKMETPSRWRSILVHGVFEELQQIDAKANLRRFSQGIRDLLMRKGVTDEAFISEFSSKSADGKIPMVYRMRILSWSGRSRGME